MRTRRRSVLHVFQPAEGGVPEHVVQLAAGMVDRGWDVHVVAPGASQFVPRLQEAGARVHPHPLDPRVLVRLDRAQRFSIVHAHSSKAGAIVRSLLPDRRRIVYSPHCFSFSAGFGRARRELFRAIEQALIPRTGALIAASDWEAREAERLLYGGRGLTRVIRYGVPACSDAAAADPDVLRFKGELPLIGTLCRLEPQKDPVSLVRAAAELRDIAGDSFRVAVVGNGVLERSVREEIQRLRVDSLVRVFPFRGEARPYLRAMDLFALPSLWESLPISVLQAMSCGLPVVASDVGGTSEAVREGRTGHLVPPAQPRALAAALAPLVADPGCTARLGAAGRDAAEREFTFTGMVETTLALYEELRAR